MAIDPYMQSWQNRFELAEAMQPLLGKLYRNQGVEILVYGRPLLNATTIELIKEHRRVRLYEGKRLPLKYSYPFLECLRHLDVHHCKVDVGRLAVKYLAEHDDMSGVEDYLRRELAAVLNARDDLPERDVVLYGFGRIGRLLARLLIERTGRSNKLRLKAIVLRGRTGGQIERRASLLRRDSVHGPFNGSVQVDEAKSAIIANGTYIQVIYADAPDQVDYRRYGIDAALVVDNTGVWRDEEGLGRHLASPGVAKVLLTAPGKGRIKNIVYGVNDDQVQESDRILSAASCTTNAITPVLKAVSDRYGIDSGHVETIHAYTNDQNLLDNYHKADRRGRSAALNMVITKTGAASAVAKALPELKGRLTGNAIRVPTPDVSMAILNLNLREAVTREALNDYLRGVALHSELRNQVDFTASTEAVSSDLVGTRFAGLVDSQATIAVGKRVVLYVWYDNEFGYSCQVMGLMQKILGLEIPSLPGKGSSRCL